MSVIQPKQQQLCAMANHQVQLRLQLCTKHGVESCPFRFFGLKRAQKGHGYVGAIAKKRASIRF
jgi:hypothetical protein